MKITLGSFQIFSNIRVDIGRTPLVSGTTLVASQRHQQQFTASVNYNSGKFASGINDTGGAFATDVNDTGGK
jgi:hypothetical protein